MNFCLLGHHRSGSSYLLDLIRHHPKIDTINEPFSMHLKFFRRNEAYWGREDFKKGFLHDNLKDIPETVNFINELNEWLIDTNGNTRGFKETALFEKYDWLKEVLNFNKTIVIVRDPRAIINSVLRRGLDKSWWDYKARLINYYNYDERILNHREEICAYIIKERYKYLDKISKEKDVLLVRLEDIYVDYEKFIKKIMNFLELDISEEQKDFYIETSKETRDSTYSNFRFKNDVMNLWKEKLSQKEVSKIEKILKEEIDKFGYKR